MKKIRYAKVGMLLLCLTVIPSITGCSGSDTREKIDDVVEEAAGKKDIERMKRMKQDIEQIKKGQKDRYDQMAPDEK